MIINYEPQHIDLEEQGQCNLVLIAARYAGPRSSIAVGQYRQDAAWPGASPFQSSGDRDDPEPGPAQGALIPDWTDEDTDNRTVETLEADPDIEVFYRPEDIAREMLTGNYLDPNVFGRGFNADLRDRVFDALGLEDVGVRNEAEYRAQLREIAGIDADAEERRAETRDDSRVSEYRREHARPDLINAASILGHEDANGAGRIELATWLADQDAEAVRFALAGKVEAARDVLAGDDPADTSEFTAADAEAMYDFDELKAVVKTVREGTGEFSLSGASTASMAAFLVEDKGLGEAEIDAHLTG